MRINLSFLSSVVAGIIFFPVAVHADNDNQVSIVEHITADGENEVVMPEELLNRIGPDASIQIEDKTERKTAPTSGRMAGYRVQVFSDNNTRTAKSEANNKARQIRAKFPQYQTHVMFTSPYWRLRVGDFKTQKEAEAAASSIKAAFPSMSKEIRVVKDRVNIVAE
ncbi:MAG: SPOR domain-containing protein [Muribaculaceae bacterium]|nr:SPOR domain-containing protein [Muribaculaceae bacterium]